jgi:hypothetical protein
MPATVTFVPVVEVEEDFPYVTTVGNVTRFDDRSRDTRWGMLAEFRDQTLNDFQIGKQAC